MFFLLRSYVQNLIEQVELESWEGLGELIIQTLNLSQCFDDQKKNRIKILKLKKMKTTPTEDF